ncbi:hypothetical protein R6242_10770 [Iodobacter sp. CM08]|uniref:hypothetical protein n=1 Tax=Iodobacter sp. CM08 TaxID=3085902 RepID=UPI0029820C24|nr:hypothetical protein [Iodobacter sp. CM08]MDW5417047.1 hypothetical protein [Iodobacter sp. CM08]
MQTYEQVFSSDGTYVLNQMASYLRILDCSGPVNVRLFQGGRVIEESRNVEAGYWLKQDAGNYFDRIEVDSKAGYIKLGITSNANAGYDRVSGKVDSRAVTALSVLNKPMLIVGLAEVVVVPQNVARASLRLFNTSTANIWIGGAGLNIVDAAIKLAAGELWIEETAAGAAWVAIADAAGAQLKIQEIIY